MRSTFFCSLAFLFLSTLHIGAQDTDYRPNFIPPSPDAAALGKYAEYPVGLYTGTLPLTIPIYAVTDGELGVPVQLSYHASGNKVEEAASFAGLGFTLNAGGAVMRSVRNLPDDYPIKGFVDYSNSYSENYLNTDPNRFIQWEEIAKGCADAEPDAFFFNFNGYTGSFSYDWSGNIVIQSPMAWKIQALRTNPATPGRITSWKLTSDDGTVYTFSNLEQTTITDNGFPCQAGITYTSAWYLTTIKTANAGRTISFTYEDYTQNFNMYHSVTHKIFCYPNSGSCQLTATDPTTNFTQLVYNCKRIKTITTSDNGTSVTFNYLTNRTDEPGTGLKQLDEIVIKNKDATELRKFLFTYDYSTGRLTLRSIKKALTDEPPYRFDYNAQALPPRIGNGGSITSYAQDDWGYFNGKMDNSNLLKPVWKANPIAPSGPQVFYKGGDRTPDVNKMQAGMLSRLTYPTGGSTEFFYAQHEYGSIGSQTVESLGEFVTVQNGIEDKEGHIGAYADGGAQTNTYETPILWGEWGTEADIVIAWSGKAVNAGSAYIEINKFGAPVGTQPLYKKVFSLPYKMGEDFIKLPKGKYVLKAVATAGRIVGTQGMLYDDANIAITWKSRIYTTEPLKKKSASGLRIAWVKNNAYPGDPAAVLKEYAYDDGVTVFKTSSGVLNETPFYEYNNLINYAPGEIACTYDLRIAQNKAVLGYGAHIGYGKVTESSGSYGSNGKTVYTFTSEKEYPAVSYTQPPFQQASSNFYAPGNLLGTAIFKKENNLNKPVNEMTITSTEIQSASTVNGLKFRFAGGNNTAAKFIKGTYQIKSGVWYPVNMIEKEYATDAVNYVQREKNFFYENKRLKRERFSRARNAAGYDETEYYYADNFINPTTAIQSMVAMNMIGLPLEIVRSVPNGFTNGVSAAVFNTYALDASSRIVLADVKKLQLSSLIPVGSYSYAASNPTGVVAPGYSIETTFEKYDAKENLVQLTGKDGITKSFLYDKHNDGPVVAASGAAWDKIAWSGFENTNPIGYGGTWNFSGTYNTTDFYTGKRSFNGTVSLSGFPTTGYVVSFWMKGTGLFNVNTDNISGTTNWTLYETKLNGGTSLSITTPPGALIDELRIYPTEAQMASLAYDQLIGANTSTDVKSKPVFSEYDNLWRLHLVKDHNKDIVKRTNYEFEILAPLAYTLTATQTGNYTYQFQIAGGSAGYIYEWDFDDLSTPFSGTSTSVSRTFSPLTLTYTVKVKVKNSVNTLATLVKEITIQKTGGSSVCSEIQNIVITRSTSNSKQATFTVPTISGASYWWDFGDNTAATTASAIHVYPTVANTVNYNVNVTVSVAGKSCSAKTSIKINP